MPALPAITMIIQGKFKILSNKKAGPDYFKMAIYAPGIARKAAPGQFVHLRCQNSAEPLLRRPFSFHRLSQNNFEILYKVVGRGTNLLAKRRKGDKIDVLGPLGNGFTTTHYTLHATRSKIILVAGGMGVAPLLALAEHIVHNSQYTTHSKKGKLYVLIGASTKGHILCEKDFKKLGAEVLITTEDGSKGRKGLITAYLEVLLSTVNSQLSTVYACGPKAMLKEVARLSLRFGISAYASLEEDMACGVGACLGCAVKTTAGYKRVCKDGPVFNLREIKW